MTVMSSPPMFSLRCGRRLSQISDSFSNLVSSAVSAGPARRRLWLSSAVFVCSAKKRLHKVVVVVEQPDGFRCFRHQLLLPRPYLVLTKPLRLDIQCQRAASVKIGWKYLDD